MVRLAFRALLLVVGFCPIRKSDGMRGPLLECLPHKFGTRPSPMHPGLFSAAGQHRCDSAVALQLGGSLISIALGTHRRDQSGYQGSTSTVQGLEDRKITLLVGYGFDSLVIGANRLAQ